MDRVLGEVYLDVQVDLTNVIELKYKTTGTSYTVQGFCKIKQEDGGWVEGLIYNKKDGDVKDTYCRPLHLFSDNKWELIKKVSDDGKN